MATALLKAPTAICAPVGIRPPDRSGSATPRWPSSIPRFIPRFRPTSPDQPDTSPPDRPSSGPNNIGGPTRPQNPALNPQVLGSNPRGRTRNGTFVKGECVASIPSGAGPRPRDGSARVGFPSHRSSHARVHHASPDRRLDLSAIVPFQAKPRLRPEERREPSPYQSVPPGG